MNNNVQASDNTAGDAIASFDFGVRYSLGGMFWLFVLISFELLVCSLFPLLTLVCVPLTIAAIRTKLLIGQRARLGYASSFADCVELFWGAVLMTCVSLLSFALAAVWGFSFGAALEYVFISDRGSYLVGGIIGAVLAAGVAPFAWWRTIQSNWIFDLQAKSSALRNVPESFSTNDRLQRFQFDLATVFEVTTYVALMAILGTYSPWITFATAVPFVTAIVAVARFSNRKRQAGEAITLVERYAMFIRAMAGTCLLLLSIVIAFAAGYFGGSLVAASLTADRVTQAVLGGCGGVAFALVTICVWACTWRHSQSKT